MPFSHAIFLFSLSDLQVGNHIFASFIFNVCKIVSQQEELVSQ